MHFKKTFDKNTNNIYLSELITTFIVSQIALDDADGGYSGESNGGT